MMAEAVSRRHFTADVRILSRSMGFVAGKVALGQVFCPAIVIPPMLHAVILFIYHRRHVVLPVDSIVTL
jgi:hypothetical protein